MQYRTPICQPHAAPVRVLSPISSATRGTPSQDFEQSFVYGAVVPLVRGAAQEVEHTASRRSGPRRWLRAVAQLTAADLHPRAGATTLRVAGDLAGRMDYDSGHVRYCLDETAARLELSRATVKRHVAVLRELGLLAWVVRGTKANIRRVLGLPGYAGTATVYGAVIPPVYDRARGHEVVGVGYDARVVVHQEGPGAVDNPPASNVDEPPSLSVVKEERRVEVEGGLKNTSRKRASRPTASHSPVTVTTKSRSNSEGRRSPAQVARDCWIASQVRPRVNWTQREGIRRLAFALRPLIDQGMGAHDIAAELHSWMLLWRPERPAAYIRAELGRRAAEAAAAASAVHPLDHPEMRAWLAEHEQLVAAAEDGPRTDADRQAARESGWADLSVVAEHLADCGPDDTVDLFGPRLASLAGRLAASGARLAVRW